MTTDAGLDPDGFLMVPRTAIARSCSTGLPGPTLKLDGCLYTGNRKDKSGHSPIFHQGKTVDGKM